jgi:D-aminopeptidase
MPTSLDSTTRATIERILADAVGEDAPGVAVGVTRSGKTVFTGGVGFANLDTRLRFDADTSFRICSITKQFMCALICQEVARKRIDINAHPSHYVERLRWLDPALTIAHLMQNKSGIRDQWVLAMTMGAKAEQRFTLEDGLEVMRRAPESMFVPGSQTLYCNGNFELLALILEAVTARHFADVLRDEILVPLNMRDTYVGVDTAAALPDDVQGYRWHTNEWVSEQNAVHWGGSAGIVSTVNDLLKWDACLRDPAAHGLPWVAQITAALPFNDGARATYASGINHLQMNGRSILTHQGALRGWRSILLRFVEEDVSIVVFMNRTNAPPREGPSRMPRGVAYAIADALGVAPVWRDVRSVRRIPKSLPTQGWFVSREQGMLLQLEVRAGQAQAQVHLQSDWITVFARNDEPSVLTSEDKHLKVTIKDAGSLNVQLADANVLVPLSRVALLKISAAQRAKLESFPRSGSYRCAPLASTFTLEREGDDTTLRFDGIFGAGICYPLHVIAPDVAWFEIARGVDESPPGRVLVIYDREAKLFELSCPLARRMVFREAR